MKINYFFLNKQTKTKQKQNKTKKKCLILFVCLFFDTFVFWGAFLPQETKKKKRKKKEKRKKKRKQRKKSWRPIN